MATINSMANNTYMMLTMAQNNGLTLFGSNTAASAKSGDIWSNYGNSSAAASAMMSGISEVSSSKRELLASYDNAAKGFKQAGFAWKDTMGTDKMPQITQDTHNEITKRFDDLYAQLTGKAAEEGKSE